MTERKPRSKNILKFQPKPSFVDQLNEQNFVERFNERLLENGISPSELHFKEFTFYVDDSDNLQANVKVTGSQKLLAKFLEDFPPSIFDEARSGLPGKFLGMDANLEGITQEPPKNWVATEKMRAARKDKKPESPER